jgi:hypothetical protein
MLCNSCQTQGKSNHTLKKTGAFGKIIRFFRPYVICNEEVWMCTKQTRGGADQTAEMEVDHTHNEQAFLSHKKARLQLEPIQTAYNRKTKKDLVANITEVS